MQFLGLPFGLGFSPYWTTKLAKVIITHLCSRGMVLVWCVDDILLLNTSPTKLLDNLQEIVCLLTSLGDQLNQEKCHLTPSQTIQYLGQHINLTSRNISPTASKLVGCKRLCKQLTVRNHTQPCRLAKLAGCLLDLAKGAMSLSGIPRIVMHVAGTMAQHGWYTYLQKPKLLKGLLNQAKLELTRIQPFLVATTLQPIKVYLTTDACDYG